MCPHSNAQESDRNRSWIALCTLHSWWSSCSHRPSAHPAWHSSRRHRRAAPRTGSHRSRAGATPTGNAHASANRCRSRRSNPCSDRKARPLPLDGSSRRPRQVAPRTRWSRSHAGATPRGNAHGCTDRCRSRRSSPCSDRKARPQVVPVVPTWHHAEVRFHLRHLGREGWKRHGAPHRCHPHRQLRHATSEAAAAARRESEEPPRAECPPEDG